jgi:hypothetical protein
MIDAAEKLYGAIAGAGGRHDVAAVFPYAMAEWKTL